MGRAEIGMLARSKAGHDKDTVYVIINRDETYVYLADGCRRTISNPKRKKEKHIQLICARYDLQQADDIKIKRILKVFDKEMRGE